MNKKNQELISKYPFLRIRNAMTGKLAPMSYDQTYMDWIPDGWRVAFGDTFIKELSQALGDEAKDFRILDIKEKFGGLRFYTNGCNRKAYDVIHKYEQLSYLICITCGDKATKISKGWICPYCDVCAKKLNDKQTSYMKVDFIPIEEYYKKYDHEMIEEEE
jgi:hypothetical protein